MSKKLLGSGLMRSSLLLQRGGLVRVLPRKAFALAAKVTIRSGRLEDRLAQIEALDNALRRQREVLPHQLFQLGLIDLACAERLHQYAHRLSHADCISKLHLATVSQLSRNNILRHISSHISG